MTPGTAVFTNERPSDQNGQCKNANSTGFHFRRNLILESSVAITCKKFQSDKCDMQRCEALQKVMCYMETHGGGGGHLNVT